MAKPKPPPNPNPNPTFRILDHGWRPPPGVRVQLRHYSTPQHIEVSIGNPNPNVPAPNPTTISVSLANHLIHTQGRDLLVMGMASLAVLRRLVPMLDGDEMELLESLEKMLKDN